MSEGGRCVVTARRRNFDRNDTLNELIKGRLEQEHLVAVLEQRAQTLECLQRCEDELLNKVKTAKKLLTNLVNSPKEQAADQNVKKAEKEANEKEVEMKMLKEEYTQMQHTKQELLLRMQSYTVHQDYMQQVVKLTRFEDEASLAGHLENLLRIREQLCEKQRLAEDQMDQQRKALLTFNSQHHMMLLQCNNQLAQMHRKLDRAHSEAEHWETKWKHIHSTAAKATLLLGQIKMATLNLYELTGGDMEGEKGVPLNDNDTQLDKIRMFIQDHKDIVRQHQSSSHKNDAEMIKHYSI
ncbi:coiled-coil domain-containing protein 42-like [Corythoichthys intestinalis]|uniref:coiled-coil domain-containing protein 42-like n=1 Tax=Corythoichthys intestinalis TaxID=161448 RepID=UPI0025A5BF7C|nr:coiled-coil domain-containing protein 42-like [Corythoichthys intestinalis]